MKTSSAKLVLMASLAALSTACTGVWNGPEQALTVAEEHPITVDSQVVTLTLDADPSADELSSVDKARIRAFADAYLNGGHGPLSVTAPSGAARGAENQGQAAMVRNYLNEVGVDWASISGASYQTSAGGSRELVLSYTHYVATASACGIWSGVKARDYSNLRSPNFGCATQNNLAAMVADPRDLIQPADGSSADAPARIRAINAYRAGEVSASETDGEIKAEIAE